MAKRSWYSVLDIEQHEIRLVVLQPAEETAALIQCELKTVSLDNNAQYEALSYEWGRPGGGTTIQLDGEEFEVGDNLHNALRRLRQRTSSRVLWIDAICIDQQDIEEKNTQVLMMGEIYKGAIQVVAYLGERVSGALDALVEMSKDKANHFSPSMEPHINSDALENLVMVSQFLQKGWWSRVWTVQETILARDLVFVCGARTFPFGILEDACSNFLDHSQGCCQNVEDYTHEDFRRRRMLPLDLLELSMAYRTREATVLHDKIFGFLGLSAKATRDQLVVDYGKPLSQCFVDNTVALIQSSKTLDVFSYVWNPKPQHLRDNTRRLEELPSWVPDWRQEMYAAVLQTFTSQSSLSRKYNACGGTDAKISLEGTDLYISGLEVDRILEVGQSNGDDTGAFAIRDALLKSWRALAFTGKDPKLPYPSGGSIEEAFRSTLCGNFCRLSGQPLLSVPATQVYERLLFVEWWSIFVQKNELTLFSMEDYQMYPDFINAISKKELEDLSNLTSMMGMFRRFVVTENGYFGLAPRQAKKGDLICVLHGGKTPYVLRAVDGDKHIMVGNSYVHGLMNGEAIEKLRSGILAERTIILTERPLPLMEEQVEEAKTPPSSFSNAKFS